MPDVAGMVTQVAASVLSVRPLVDVLDRPVRIECAAAACKPAAALLTLVAAIAGAPPMVVESSGPLDEEAVFERAASERLAIAAWPRDVCAVALDAPDLVERAVREAMRDEFEGRCRRAMVTSFDGTRLRTYATGPPDAPPLVLVSACGIPAKLSDRWVRALERDHLVVLWETRGMVDDVAGGELGACDVVAQVEDLRAVMDHHGLDRVPLIGLCAGSVVALAAAAALPTRVSSLSLCHGNYQLGPDCPRSRLQRDLENLMSMVATRAVPAEAMHTWLRRALIALPGTPWAHVALYPYATPSLLLRYCRLVWTLASTDVRPWLSGITQPVLVVTSEDDRTVHPGLSVTLASLLPQATLHVATHGDHLMLFDADPGLVALVRRFTAESAPSGLAGPTARG